MAYGDWPFTGENSEIQDLTLNPWTGVNAWREFLFDMQHPGQLWQRMKEGTSLAWADWVEFFR